MSFSGCKYADARLMSIATHDRSRNYRWINDSVRTGYIIRPVCYDDAVLFLSFVLP